MDCETIKREIWHNVYIEQLIDIYGIVRDVIKERYPNQQINWNDTSIFQQLSVLLHHSSSQRVPV